MLSKEVAQDFLGRGGGLVEFFTGCVLVRLRLQVQKKGLLSLAGVFILLRKLRREKAEA